MMSTIANGLYRRQFICCHLGRGVQHDPDIGNEGKLGAYAMQRVAAGAHLPTPRLFEPAQRLDDKADYCVGCSYLP